MWTLLLAILVAQPEKRPFTSPESAQPEYGYGLSADDARAGWIALFDGQTTFGWEAASVDAKILASGTTTCVFGSCELKGEAAAAGEITVADQALSVPAGRFERRITVKSPGPIRLRQGVKLKSVLLKPIGLKPMLNGKDLAGWTIIKHPRLPDTRQTRWSVEDGALHAVGGPGAVELEGRYGELVVQIEVRMRKPLVNGGLFFRSVPGQFMNGYEAQLFNGCYDHDPAQPARYSTGAIDDRQLARRLVSRDLAPLTMTVIATGPHIATWVNGWQMTDWTDTRPNHENPREGLRVEPGTIQLQAHDPETDIEFRRLEIAEMK
ncbi:MAG: DUF1080 domain-containing protein [Planctomycetia bacterium]|nr:DUF1080 domain-containing protein [Planctomycetia bacterium]